MCGIAGWLGSLSEQGKYSERILKALYHRGPDGQGVRAWPEATLLHTRLSILDLSVNGSQPIANEDRTVWAVFNGEIYNHRELRKDLESRGHVFKGHSDSEILPHLYEEFGSQFVNRLRGMFALAIYDTRSRTLILARDRFGIKPLFYAYRDDRFMFASEIRALLEFPDINRCPDKQAIYDFAALFYIPAPETFYIGIRALEPGMMIEVQLDNHRVLWNTRRYHQWTVSPDSTMTLTQAAERAESLIKTAVSRQLESDVPLGALLSGGIDSSLVSAVAQEALGRQLRTFNEHFSEKQYDETWAALAVAHHIGSQHETLNMDQDCGNWDYVRDLLVHTGQPFADTSLFAAHAICRLVRRYLTVALSGDGGDEVFGGYDYYWWINAILKWQSLPSSLQQSVVFLLNNGNRYGLVPPRLGKRAQDLSGRDDTSIVQYIFCLVREEEHALLCRDEGCLPVRRLFEPQWKYGLPSQGARLENLAAQVTEVNMRLCLPNDYLFKVDTASMKESLEIRVPFLDEDLVAFGLHLPYRLKVKGRMCKLVLRRIAQRRLPTRVANKPKRGFAIPFDTWTNPEFKDCVKEVLLGSSSRIQEFFHPEAYKPLVAAFCDGRSYPGISRSGLYQRVVMLLSVQLALGYR